MKLNSLAVLLALMLAGCAALFDNSSEMVKQESQSDAIITTHVKAKLIKAGDLDAAAIRVESDQGVVRLSGFVDSEQQRQRAAALARSVSGVKEVSNSIEVK